MSLARAARGVGSERGAVACGGCTWRRCVLSVSLAVRVNVFEVNALCT